MLRAAHSSDMPVLGICLGHQIIADCFGGDVSVGLASQDEEGAARVSLSEAGRTDPLLGTLDHKLVVVESHHDAVVSLPPGAQLLASGARCPIHAMRLGSIVSVQFHPECAPDVAVQWAARGGYDSAAVTQKLSIYDDYLTRTGLTGLTLAAGFVQAAQS
ncbi:type 1 glutamine amidotransferase [Corynebacterium ureicelerivorans]|uniref:type 1 glutamine amidotransferase n=1 Tax=uncultured Corynebacterium sp. TaxID=159447 RepID=UPI00259B898C|nr:type 1 glutamine amidotransferase [uncultured Corynebacterium sp.]